MLNQDELDNIVGIQGKYYMSPVLRRIDASIEKRGAIETLSYLHEIIVDARNNVIQIIERRKKDGHIKDVSQASKTVVGAIFSNAIVYVFLKAKESGLIRDNIYITTNLKAFKDLIAIKVDGETQKPDMDLVIYSEKENGELNKLMIVSLKTSLRERAGQTYKWKLLLEIATTNNSIKDKYNIEYPLENTPLVCFATINFYDEINNPQHKGMFKFFDKSFIGKPLNADFIDNLSSLIEYADTNL